MPSSPVVSDPIVVSLTARESVHGRGTRKLTWRAYIDGEWKNPRDMPHAECTAADVGPGVVWETCVSIPLPRGTWLMRLISQPLEERHSDPLFYLANRKSTRRQVKKSFYRVGKVGVLKRASPEDEPPLSD